MHIGEKSISDKAEVQAGAKIGSGVRIAPFALITCTAEIGDGVVVGPYSVVSGKVGSATEIKGSVEIRPGTEIGRHCYIDSGVKFSGNCRIGNRVTIRYDAIIARDVEIGDDVFIAPQVMTIYSDHKGNKHPGTKVAPGVFVGTASVIHHGVQICEGVVIGAMSLVTKHIDKPGIYAGRPAVWVRDA